MFRAELFPCDDADLSRGFESCDIVPAVRADSSYEDVLLPLETMQDCLSCIVVSALKWQPTGALNTQQ